MAPAGRCVLWLLAAAAARRLASAARDSLEGHGVLASGGASEARAQRSDGQDRVTIILLDVDGVLNVVYPSPGKSGLCLLAHGRIAAASRIDLADVDANSASRPKVRLLTAIAQRQLVDDSFEQLALTELRYSDAQQEGAPSSSNSTHLYETFVMRLVDIIKAAGKSGRVQIAISSTWRFPVHKQKLKTLKELLQLHAGHELSFSTTKIEDEQGRPVDEGGSATKRVAYAGELVETFLEDEKNRGVREVRILMLDDFGVADISHEQFQSQGPNQYGAAAVESALVSRVPPRLRESTVAKLVHTYDAWEQGYFELSTTRPVSGRVTVEIGCGLIAEKYQQALEFVRS